MELVKRYRPLELRNLFLAPFRECLKFFWIARRHHRQFHSALTENQRTVQVFDIGGLLGVGSSIEGDSDARHGPWRYRTTRARS